MNVGFAFLEKDMKVLFMTFITWFVIKYCSIFLTNLGRGRKESYNLCETWSVTFSVFKLNTGRNLGSQIEGVG